MRVVALGWSTLCAALCATTACSTAMRARRAIPGGYACHRTFQYEAYPRRYACLFELSAPSAFYDDGEVDKALDAFESAEGGACVRQREREFADRETMQTDHGLTYRYFAIECR